MATGGAFGVGGLLLKTTSSMAFDFRRRQGMAERLGANLRWHISHIPDARRRRINLVGHSLGARVIHYGLAENDWSDYRLGDVVLLGVAADAGDDDWPECAAELEGEIFNVYCESDRILKYAPVGEAYIGRHGIRGRRKGIRNFH